MIDYRYGFMGCGWGWGWVVMMICLLAFTILGVILLIRYLQPPEKAVENNALKILNERYAKGEITAEEYRRMKAEIKD